MLEFPSMEKARALYDSPEYQEVLPIRLDANKDKMVIFEGAVVFANSNRVTNAQTALLQAVLTIE
jgi:Domain of unknown function (DUF1330)